LKNISLINKKIVVVGLSRSGFAAAMLAEKKNARVFVSEIQDTKLMRQKAKILRKKNIFVELGAHTEKFFKNADFFIISPGIKNNAYPVVWAKKNEVPIFSEIEFASWFCRAPIVAITGSNGKTTVTALIGKILKKSGRKVVICGNIGNPFSGEYPQAEKADVVVLEVSSFQLQYVKHFHPKVSIILNITQNHFDHHVNMREYVQAKSNIFINQKKHDACILNFSDERVFALRKKIKSRICFFSRKSKNIEKFFKEFDCGCFLKQDEVYMLWKSKIRIIFRKALLKVRGDHNLDNAMAAIIASRLLGVKLKTAVNTLQSFRGLEHRCEKAGKKNGISFVNDSKSTTVDATAKALSMFENNSVILICGGRDKGSNFRNIRPLVKKKVRLLIAIGEARNKIVTQLRPFSRAVFSKNLNQAVRLAYKNAYAKDTILLSPMCASFDMFDNFKQRGRVFKTIVKKACKK